MVRLVTLLGVAGAFVGLLPGEHVYGDANRCLDQAFGEMFGHSGLHSVCTPSYTSLVASRPAGGLPLVLLVAAAVTYGAVLVRYPRRWAAVTWSAWTATALVAFFVATFRVDLFTRSVTLWPTPVAYALIGAMLLLIFPVTPIVVFASTRGGPSVRP